MAHPRLSAAASVLIFLTAVPAQAQPDTQLWAEFKFSWINSRNLTYGLDVEPKVLLSKPDDDPGWATTDLTPSIEYTRGQWFDLLGEFLVGRTRQTDDVSTTEVTPRVGMRFHLLANLRDDLSKEKRPKHRTTLRNLVRLEWRNLFYSTDTPNASTLRLRNRVEFLCALTRPRITDDGATYLLSDAEWFWQLEDVDERYANKQRLRAGLGYRHDSAWRFEGLLILNRSRNTIGEGFTTSDVVFDLTVKRVW
jgi:hypothetical protein